MSVHLARSRALPGILALVLCGCGGSSEEIPVEPLPPAPSSFHEPGWIGAFGATISGTTPQQLVAVTSEEFGFIGVYGEQIATDFKARGVLLGISAADVTPPRYQGSNFELTVDPVLPAISGTMTAGSERRTNAGGTLAAVGYRLDLAARLSDVAGHWELTTDSGNRMAMDVDPEGNNTGEIGPCSIRDSKLAPTRTGHGVFAISLQFRRGLDTCVPPLVGWYEFSGFAVVYSPLAGGSQLVLAALGGWDATLAASGKR